MIAQYGRTQRVLMRKPKNGEELPEKNSNITKAAQLSNLKEQ